MKGVVLGPTSPLPAKDLSSLNPPSALPLKQVM